MRRVCCWSAAGLVFVTAAAVGAGYVRHHPSALVARVAGITYTAATWCLCAGQNHPAPSQACSGCVCPKSGPVVFSDMQDPQALRATLGQLRVQMAADVGDIEECEPIHGTMPLIQGEPSTSADVLPPTARDTALPAEMDLAQMWLHLFGDTKASKKKTPKPAEAGQGSPEEAELANPNRPAKCLEDPTLDLQYPGCPYTGPLPGAGKRPALTPRSKGPFEDRKSHSFRYSLPDPSGAHEEVPVHPEVDTMEFRPSDAQDGEFDPHPL